MNPAAGIDAYMRSFYEGENRGRGRGRKRMFLYEVFELDIEERPLSSSSRPGNSDRRSIAEVVRLAER